MPILGNDAAPGFSFHAYQGNSFPNQEAEAVTLPAQRVRILELGAWVGGWNGACKLRLTLWSEARAVLAQSAEITVPNKGSGANGQVDRVTGLVLVPYDGEPGEIVWAGFTRDRSDAHQVSTGSTINQHFHGRGAYPGDPFGEIELYTSQARRIGAWIEDYEPIATAHTRRGAAWADPETVIRRAGAWADPESVQVRRTGAWIDAD